MPAKPPAPPIAERGDKYLFSMLIHDSGADKPRPSQNAYDADEALRLEMRRHASSASTINTVVVAMFRLLPPRQKCEVLKSLGWVPAPGSKKYPV